MFYVFFLIPLVANPRKIQQVFAFVLHKRESRTFFFHLQYIAVVSIARIIEQSIIKGLFKRNENPENEKP